MVWFAVHESGVHATVAGVMLGLMTPAKTSLPQGMLGDLLRHAGQLFSGEHPEGSAHGVPELRKIQQLTRESISPLEYLEQTLHPWSSFFIMPLFALANAGVSITVGDLTNSIALAVLLGLVVGKPIGVTLFSWFAVKSGWARLPAGVSWPALAAAGILAGIGFTMALFIAELALANESLVAAKVGVLVASVVSAAFGMTLLARVLSPATRT